MGSSTFITRVALENYKSIARCDVSLGALTFLVGRNGSGKSNFLDALRFVADSLRTSLDQAVRSRVSTYDIRRRGSGPTFLMLFQLWLPDQLIATYSFSIRASSFGSFDVVAE